MNHIRKIREDDREWINNFIQEQWGSSVVVSKGVLHHPSNLPGFIIENDGVRQGLLTYRINQNECEIVTLNSQVECRGIGSALIDSMRKKASELGCDRIWLITTNDNMKAIRFYQKRGFVLAALHRNAIEESRKLKPEIPQRGADGIPIRDEIEMEMMLRSIE